MTEENISELRNSKITKHYHSKLTKQGLLIFSTLLIIYIIAIVSILLYRYSNHSFLAWLQFIMIALVAVTSQLAVAKYREIINGEIYPTEEHMYYPFDESMDGLLSDKRYERAKHNSKLAYCDPTYISRISNVWTKIDRLPQQIRWLQFYSDKGHLISMKIAILPISLSAWKEGSIVLRVFVENPKKKSNLVKVTGYTQAPNQHLIRQLPKTLFEIKTSSHSLAYKDFSFPNPFLVTGQIWEFYVTCTWTTDIKRDGKKIGVQYHGRLVTRLRLLPTTPKINPNAQESIINMKLQNNPFVSPHGLKEVLLFSTTHGRILSKIGYNWHKKFEIPFLILIYLCNAIMIYLSIYIWSSTGHNLLLLLIGYLVIAFTTFDILSFKEAKNTKKLHSIGLIKNINYVSLNDLVLDQNTDPEWFKFTSVIEKIRDLSFPVDYCISFDNMPKFKELFDREINKMYGYKQFQYRKSQINLSPLHIVPAFEPEFATQKIKFDFKFPDRKIPFLRMNDEVKFKQMLNHSNQNCSNCGSELLKEIAYCQICGDPIIMIK